MKENISIITAAVAIIISIAAVTSAVFIKPEATLDAGTIGVNELADNSVTSGKVADGALTDADISDSGISKIAGNAITSDQIASSSITLLHLTSEVIAAMTGVVDIANNSITGAKIANGAITNTHISGSADIDPSKILGTAWTATNDGSGSGLDADKLDGKSSDEFADTIHSHSGLLLGTTVLDVSCTSKDVFSTDYKKILDVGTFTKLDSDSLVDITFNGRIFVNSLTGTGAKFELRVDDSATTNGRARANIKSSEVGLGGIWVSMKGIFTGLDAGSHTVSIWVRASTGTGTDAYVDPGCWSTDHIVIMEFK